MNEGNDLHVLRLPCVGNLHFGIRHAKLRTAGERQLVAEVGGVELLADDAVVAETLHEVGRCVVGIESVLDVFRGGDAVLHEIGGEIDGRTVCHNLAVHRTTNRATEFAIRHVGIDEHLRHGGLVGSLHNVVEVVGVGGFAVGGHHGIVLSRKVRTVVSDGGVERALVAEEVEEILVGLDGEGIAVVVTGVVCHVEVGLGVDLTRLVEVVGEIRTVGTFLFRELFHEGNAHKGVARHVVGRRTGASCLGCCAVHLRNAERELLRRTFCSTGGYGEAYHAAVVGSKGRSEGYVHGVGFGVAVAFDGEDEGVHALRALVVEINLHAYGH